MLNDLTFITSLQIESKNRLRNCITVFSYLAKKFPESKILIKEVDTESKFLQHALPEIENRIGKVDNINHVFENNGGLFNKSKNLNELVTLSDTSIIWNYDVDVLMPETTYHQAYNMLIGGEYDVVYPYGCGVYQWNVLNFDNHFDNFFDSNFNLKQLDQYSQRLPSVQGFCQVFNKKSFIRSYGLNENFIFVGYEDTEFLYRMSVLGNKIGRVNDDIYHLDHTRTHNRNYSDQEFFEKNIMLWEWIRRQDKNTIVDYYEQQEYIKKLK